MWVDMTIQSLLEKRGAWLKGDMPDSDHVLHRQELTRLIGNSYSMFEVVRDRLLNSGQSVKAPGSHLQIEWEWEKSFIEQLLSYKMLLIADDGHEVCETQGLRYLSGGWLEELAWLAAREAGAEEAVFGQVIGWTVKGFTGENEIDLIARRGDALTFISCKALKSELDMRDKKHRNRLMEAVHEADNIADHFGSGNGKVAVLVTTDLHDEQKGTVRYNALMGKAAVLNVEIVSLEKLQWDKLVSAMTALIHG